MVRINQEIKMSIAIGVVIGLAMYHYKDKLAVIADKVLVKLHVKSADPE